MTTANNSADSYINAKAISESKAPGCARIAVGAFGSIFFIMGAIFLWLAFLAPVLEWQGARSWDSTEATITSSKIEEHDSDDGSSYSAEFEYRFVVDGQEYQGDRYSFLKINGSHASAKKLIAKHPVGSKLPISYNPDNPKDCVMDNSIGWSLLFGLIPLVFVVIGAGIMLLAIFGWSTGNSKKKGAISSGAKKIADQEESQPSGFFASLTSTQQSAADKDSEFEGPQKLKPTYSPIAILLVAGLFTLFWNFVVSFFVREIIREGFPIFDTLFATPFVLIGLAGIGFCFYTFLSIFNPKIEVALSNGAIALGEEVDVAWEVVGNAASIRRLSIIIEGEESATYRRGTDTVTDTETFEKIEIVVSENTEQIRFGTSTIQIPAATMHSFDGGNNAIKWTIKVHGDIPRWPDVNQTMEFRVRPGGTA